MSCNIVMVMTGYRRQVHRVLVAAPRHRRVRMWEMFAPTAASSPDLEYLVEIPVSRSLSRIQTKVQEVCGKLQTVVTI